jgi:hypothetical protein
MAQGDRPVKEFRAGSVRASVWQDEVAGKDEEAFSAFSVRVEKRFKDTQGVWQSTKGAKNAGPAQWLLLWEQYRASARQGQTTNPLYTTNLHS